MAIDFEEQASGIIADAREDLDAAQSLLDVGKPRHGMFYAHLALEKVLKALVMKATGVAPPKIHDLKRLAKLVGIGIDRRTEQFLGAMNYYQIASRYLEARGHEIQRSTANYDFRRTKELFECLTSQ